ncbi:MULTISPECIES: BID domain-containing T4SS effector [unclassified Bartonella]|uniref:BID domain-containing T4SS effector n=1 Tax=unclassified Bartonella TaxID=2645622 RepID=UPI0009C1F8BE|nr:MULTISPECIES: BID domain-containing T4SS effector [unclassified Bartonella]AQX22673.1 Bartonella effector protein Bep2 [Bartonella sp. 11B]AQX24043.1 Bartonella effector protein Bep2 [Bartonella sp. 114]AQX25122.1 Bartonella effector protein Bep2 [Bartonella sp. Coyote22sub2]
MKKSEMMIKLEDINIPSFKNYVYPDSEVLKNKYGIMELQKFEERMTHDALKETVKVLEEPAPERFDSSYLKYLHKRLFQHALEWAGCTRDVPFTFSDGTRAVMPSMAKADSNFGFAFGSQIKEGLDFIDQKLAEKNYLRGLSREEFVHNAAKIFGSINYIHPFREGNGRVQRLFFVKLARSVGYKLDFSATTTKRMTYVSVEFTKNAYIEPLQHLFEDISNPEKVGILKQFISNAKEYNIFDSNEKLITVAREGKTYKGIGKFLASDFIVIEAGDTCILSNKDSLTPEQLRTFKLGSDFIFTALDTEDLKEIFIPAEKLAALSEDEMIGKILEHSSVREQRDKIQHCARFIYGRSDQLNEIINMIDMDPNLGEVFSEQIMACYDNKKYFISKKTKATDQSFCKLSNEIKNYANIVKDSRNQILKEYKERQKRCGQVVKMPSKEVQCILDMPEDMREEVLKSWNLLFLNKSISDFIIKVNHRLSPCECKAINDKNYEELAKNISISESKAKAIIKTIGEVKEIQKKIQVLRANALKATAMAC